MTDEELFSYLESPKIFWVREIFKKRAAHGLYTNLVHELQIRDMEYYFKYIF